MSKVVLLKRPYSHMDKIEERGKLIFETGRALEVYDMAVKDGKFYSVCMRCGDVVGVDEVDYELNPSEVEDYEFICPYCKCVDEDSWELDSEDDERECPSCGSKLAYKRTERGFKVTPILPTTIIRAD